MFPEGFSVYACSSVQNFAIKFKAEDKTDMAEDRT
jgi:hypothetical protein